MGRRNRNKTNPFAQKKRDKKQNLGRPDRRSEPYQDIVRENESFIKYYQKQEICPVEEWELFLKAIRSNLPTTFRITGSRGESAALLNIIKTQLFEQYVTGVEELDKESEAETSEKRVIEKPFCLPWYPNEYGWQLELTRKDIRRSEAFYKLHNFLIAETSAGSISRQEAVSMIPPIVLDVKPHHKVLDMCAAPGSKTAQLIEALHSDDVEPPSGYVVANDIDNNRCYMLVHQAKRLNSSSFMVTNHDSSVMPTFFMTNKKGEREEVKFDRVLCDVPCSGDGTLRKNPDIWLKWNSAQGLNLHGIQYRIVKRGAEQLSVGGRLVYSTCSLNPIENEAVLQRLIKECDGAMEIVDATDLVPGLKYYPGMTHWGVANRDIEFFSKFEDVPEKFHTVIRPNMYPPSAEDAEKFNLKKCLRVLPHLQNTGAFFVAVLEKKKLLPWETIRKPEVIEPVPRASEDKSEEENSGEEKTTWGPQRKKRRVYGYKEDPFVFFNDNEEVWKSLKEFYKLDDSFNPLCLLTRCIGGKKKNVYYCTEQVKNLLQSNENQMKIINTGVKTFVRCDNRNMRCAFRLANEGLGNVERFVGDCRKIKVKREDLIILLQNTDPTKPPLLSTLNEDTQKRVMEIEAGSCILNYSDENVSISLVGWRGTQSLRAYTDVNDTVHMLRLLGADLSKYEVNKFEKARLLGAEIDDSNDFVNDNGNPADPNEIVTKDDE